MQMCELAVDHERLGWSSRLAGRERERAGSRHRQSARPLDHARQREHAPRELLGQPKIGWLLVELCVRVCGRRTRALPGSARQLQ
jgi:hypothetical protein